MDLQTRSIKRLHYFNRQFLLVDDFEDQQSYHRVMRQVLNGSLFEPGVLLGLDVQFDGSNPPRNLILKPGVAVDEQGQLLVWTDEDIKKLAADKKLSLEKQAGIIFVTICFGQTLTNKTPGLDSSGDFNRTSEAPQVALTSEAPKVESSGEPKPIVLAKVDLDAKQVDTSALSGRTMAVLKSGGLNVSVPLHLDQKNSATEKEDVTALVTTENSGHQALRVIYGFNKDNQPTVFPAALAVISQGLDAHGLYVQGAPKRMEAVRVDGDALILGSATLGSVNAGAVTSICYNSGQEELNPGDLVMLGEGVIRAFGLNNAITQKPVLRAFPVEKAVFKNDDSDGAGIIGFVVGFADPRFPGKSAANSNSSIKHDENLFVVTRGFFENAKVTAPKNRDLKQGELLVGPRTKDDVPGRATGTSDGSPPQPGSVVGKAFHKLLKGERPDKFPVFVNLM